MKNFLHITFLVISTSFSLQAAEEVAPAKEPECSTCDYRHKTCESLSFEDSVLDLFSEPQIQHFADALVIVKVKENRWELALTTDITTTDEMRQIHLCEDHSSITIHHQCIRALRLIWQYSWQPRTPITVIYDKMKLFIARYKRQNATPFISAKVIDPSYKILVVGDLHGSSASLRRFLAKLYKQRVIDENCRLIAKYYLIFTGDYTDRGNHGGEVWNILADLKLINPNQVFLLKGNHEFMNMAKLKNFYKEWREITYGLKPEEQDTLLNDLFDTLAHAILLGVQQATACQAKPSYRFLLFCHGGIDEHVSFHEVIEQAIENIKEDSASTCLIYRGAKVNAGLLWSDFEANFAPDEIPTARLAKDRGNNSFVYNYSAACQYLEKFTHTSEQYSYKIDAMIRGHQHVPGGITRLAHHLEHESDWIPLQSGVPEPIENHPVYTCTSSPEGLAPFGCWEDSYAMLEWNSEKNKWFLTPMIEQRTPRRWLHLII